MYFFLILFFVSLIGISMMIGWKLATIKHEEKHPHDHGESFLSEVFDFDKIKKTVLSELKKIGHIFVWVILRTYIVSVHFLNKKIKQFWNKLKEKFGHKNTQSDTETQERGEPSKYLHMISEYRAKIRHIKHKIKEEEGIE